MLDLVEFYFQRKKPIIVSFDNHLVVGHNLKEQVEFLIKKVKDTSKIESILKSEEAFKLMNEQKMNVVKVDSSSIKKQETQKAPSPTGSEKSDKFKKERLLRQK